MTEHLLLLPIHRSVQIRRWFYGLLLACGFLCTAVACDRGLSAEETAFYERADKIKVGVTLEVVKGELGEPSRTFDAEAKCASKGGRKEWVYDSFDSFGVRKPLRAGTYSYCADEKGIVVSISRIVV